MFGLTCMALATTTTSGKLANGGMGEHLMRKLDLFLMRKLDLFPYLHNGILSKSVISYEADLL